MTQKLNTFEKQAVLSVACAAVAGAAFLAQAVGVLWKFNWSEFEIVMRSGGLRFFGIVGATGVGVLASIAGLSMGWMSAGEKRNKRSQLSWAGFFLNAGLATLTICIFVLFWFGKELVR